MKHIILFIVMAACVTGCYAPRKYPLQRGDKLILTTPERAAAFRTYTGNDPFNAGRVVEITRPTNVLCE